MIESLNDQETHNSLRRVGDVADSRLALTFTFLDNHIKHGYIIAPLDAFVKGLRDFFDFLLTFFENGSQFSRERIRNAR